MLDDGAELVLGDAGRKLAQGGFEVGAAGQLLLFPAGGSEAA
jgi:hypothetical protein